MTDLEKAKGILFTAEYTCVLCHGDIIYTSTHRGVKPLVQWLEQENDVQGFSAADKVVGKATAYLYVLLGVKTVYTHVISSCALEVLKENGIIVEYASLVENIINRKGDGICPFEEAVMEAQEPQEAYRIILHRMEEMGIALD